MAKQFILSNEQTKAIFSTRGAELISVQKDGKEKIWIGDQFIGGRTHGSYTRYRGCVRISFYLV